MALCDFLLTNDILGIACDEPVAKGAQKVGILFNRSDIDSATLNDFTFSAITLKCGGKKAYKIIQSGKTPFVGTQQEMQEGTYQNTITNTVQFVILNQGEKPAEIMFALANGDFVAIIPDKNNVYQVYGYEGGLKCSTAVRELYNDDTLAGWQVTLVEEGATRGNLFATEAIFNSLQTATSACS